MDFNAREHEEITRLMIRIAEKILPAKEAESLTVEIDLRDIEDAIILCYELYLGLRLSYRPEDRMSKKQSIYSKKLYLLYDELTSPSDEELIQQMRELVMLSGPFQTPDQDLADAWEEAGYAPKGTTYRNPSQLPQIPHRIRRQRKLRNDQLEIPNKVRVDIATLTELSSHHTSYLNEELQKEVVADPKRRQRARKLGLIP
jgi:hypothetical protein